MTATELELANMMRQGMRRLASGIVIVSANDPDGKPYAMTASSITSISDKPPSLLVCVNHSARMNTAMAATDYFSINILDERHQAVSSICADPSRIDSRFTVGSWIKDKESGLSILDDAVATFICAKKNCIDHGTHAIYIGDICSARVNNAHKKALIYLDGAYHFLE